MRRSRLLRRHGSADRQRMPKAMGKWRRHFQAEAITLSCVLTLATLGCTAIRQEPSPPRQPSPTSAARPPLRAEAPPPAALDIHDGRLIVWEGDAFYELVTLAGSSKLVRQSLANAKGLFRGCASSGPAVTPSGLVLLAASTQIEAPDPTTSTTGFGARLTLHSWREGQTRPTRFAQFDVFGGTGAADLYQWVEATRTALIAQCWCEGVILWTTAHLRRDGTLSSSAAGTDRIAAAFSSDFARQARDADTVIFSDDGALLAAGGAYWLAVGDRHTGKTARFPLKVDFFGPMAITHDKKTVVWMGDMTGQRRTWDEDKLLDYGPDFNAVGLTDARSGKTKMWLLKDLSPLPLSLCSYDHVYVTNDGAAIYMQLALNLDQPDGEGNWVKEVIGRLDTRTGAFAVIAEVEGRFALLPNRHEQATARLLKKPPH